MPDVAARLEQGVQPAHLLHRADVDRVLRLDLLGPITGDEPDAFSIETDDIQSGVILAVHVTR